MSNIYDRDNPPGASHGWIQWKGTQVCADLHCECGYHGHIDESFFYFYECFGCKKIFAVGQNIKLIPLTESEIAEVKLTQMNIHADEQGEK